MVVLFCSLAHLIENPEVYQHQVYLFDLGSCVFKVPAPFLCISVLLLSSFELGHHTNCINSSKSDWKTGWLHSCSLKKIEKRTGEEIVPTEE